MSRTEKTESSADSSADTTATADTTYLSTFTADTTATADTTYLSTFTADTTVSSGVTRPKVLPTVLLTPLPLLILSTCRHLVLTLLSVVESLDRKFCRQFCSHYCHC